MRDQTFGLMAKLNSSLLLFAIMMTMISPLCAQEIRIKPETGLVDQPVSIVLSGFDPSKTVTLRANMEDEFGQDWDSYAVFEVNRTGFADLSLQSPIRGTYKGIDPTGLIWSLSKDPGKKINMSSCQKPCSR